MSRRYPNPVSKYFIYYEKTRKSTCKACNFDMAGRHSENLMRHLKRKHKDLYDSVVADKRAILVHRQQQAKQAEDRALASMFHFPAEPKRILITKDSSRPSTNGATESADVVAGEEAGDGDNGYNASASQFDGIFIGKSELPDEVDQFDNSGDVELEAVEPSTSLRTTSASLAPSSSTTPAPTAVWAPSAVAPTVFSVRASSSNCPLDGDDSFYLQYLGNKLSKYSPRTKNTVQFQINRILYKADMGQYEDSVPPCDSD
ncbi:uncharacterized protein LOC108023269 [Drosophila biarmipes]|uniref:uncharacterized protein LOC108023269 n=1 Tax=Drosophila biarmipes TaxID=125945 RepID=UPI0007E6A7A2|nr:uncharacterized protein LOC108023269 [Drosophila biarmipes]